MSFIQAGFVALRNGLNNFATSVQAYRNWVLAGAAVGSTGALFRHHYRDWASSEGPSMYPTMPDRSHVIWLDTRCKMGRGIQIGDVIQAVHPQFPDQLVGKRVVGLPGDYVVRDPTQSPSVGGASVKGITDWKERVKQDENENVNDHVGADTDEVNVRQEPKMIQVPEGHVWVCGDNMAWSRDSRSYGPLPMALIRARTTSINEGYFTWKSLDPGKGLRKVEDWEMDAVLGNENNAGTVAKEKRRVAVKDMGKQSSNKNID